MATRSAGEELCGKRLISLTNAGCAPTGCIQMTEVRRERLKSVRQRESIIGSSRVDSEKVKVASREPS
jgi:hypothetical protein